MLRTTTQTLLCSSLLLFPVLVLALLLCLAWVGSELSSRDARASAWQEWQAAREKCIRLDDQRAIAEWRYRSKLLVLDAYEKNELSFLEAAAWFCQINRQSVDAYAMPSPDVGRTPEERACRQVIVWARRKRSLFVGHLEAELAQELARPGGLVLPEPPPLDGIPPCPQRGE